MKISHRFSGYREAKNLILQKLDGKLVGFDVDRSFLYTFNETAEFIFKKIRAQWTEERIVKALGKKYEVSATKLKQDVKQAIKDMVKNKIILVQ